MGIRKFNGRDGSIVTVKSYNKKTLLKEVKEDGSMLRYAPADLRNDPEIVMAAVKQNGLALAYAPDKLKNNPEIVMAAVKNCGEALQYASTDLNCLNEDIVLTAVKRLRPGSFFKRHLPGLLVNWKESPKIVLEAIKYDVDSATDTISVCDDKSCFYENDDVLVALGCRHSDPMHYIEKAFSNYEQELSPELLKRIEEERKKLLFCKNEKDKISLCFLAVLTGKMDAKTLKKSLLEICNGVGDNVEELNEINSYIAQCAKETDEEMTRCLEVEKKFRKENEQVRKEEEQKKNNTKKARNDLNKTIDNINFGEEKTND